MARRSGPFRAPLAALAAALAALSMGGAAPAGAQEKKVQTQSVLPPAAPRAPILVAPRADSAAPLPAVGYGEDALPVPVRRMRARIMEAARTGDLEALRPVIESNELPPVFPGGQASDPIGVLRSVSGDSEGREILAILIEVLEAGYIHVDQGTPQEMFVWPYFARFPLSRLSPEQFVELFKLITAYDWEQMQDKGVYNFYRVGIAPDGVWHFFEDGD